MNKQEQYKIWFDSNQRYKIPIEDVKTLKSRPLLTVSKCIWELKYDCPIKQKNHEWYKQTGIIAYYGK